MIYQKDYFQITGNKQEFPNAGQQNHVDFAAYSGNIHDSVVPDYIPAHWHHELEFFYLEAGMVDVTVEGEFFRLHAKECCLINSGALHSFYASSTDPCIFRSIVFHASVVSGIAGSIFDRKYVSPFIDFGPPKLIFYKNDSYSLVSELFLNAYDACKRDYDGFELDVRASLSKILYHVKTLQPIQVKPLRIPENRVKTMMEYIDAHYQEALTVSNISQSANICTRECQRLFQKYLRCRPMEYVRRKRILSAAILLSDTDMPIIEIADLCGFASHSYFSEQFRILIGKSPSDYRNNKKNP